MQPPSLKKKEGISSVWQQEKIEQRGFLKAPFVSKNYNATKNRE